MCRLKGGPSPFPSPDARGMARRQALCPDFAGRPGGSVRAALAGLTHHTDASASADAPSRYLSAFAFLGGRTIRGLYLAPLLRRPLGGGITTPAREYRIPLPSCGVPRRAPLAWNETIYHMGEFHPDVKDYFQVAGLDTGKAIDAIPPARKAVPRGQSIELPRIIYIKLISWLPSGIPALASRIPVIYQIDIDFLSSICAHFQALFLCNIKIKISLI